MKIMKNNFLSLLEEDIKVNYNSNGAEWVENMLDNSEAIAERVDALLDQFNEDNDTKLTIEEIEQKEEIFDVYNFYSDRLSLYEE